MCEGGICDEHLTSRTTVGILFLYIRLFNIDCGYILMVKSEKTLQGVTRQSKARK